MSINASPVRLSVEIAVSLLLVAFIVFWCFQILAPFITFMLWGAVIAISLHTPFCRLRARTGGKMAVTIFAVTGLLMVLIPAWLFIGSIIESVELFADAVRTGTFNIPPPADSIREWPMIGERLYGAWASASDSFEQFLGTYSEQLKGLAVFGLGRVASLGLTVLLFIASTAIAVAMLANDESIERFMRKLFDRVVGKTQGEEAMTLTTATIRSVTMGVLGVAFIQAVAAGIGMLVAGVPGAGLWALVILVLAIAQLPPWLVMFPVAFYVFSIHTGALPWLFLVWAIIVSFSDAVLKPLLLGRGVNVPTLIILLGAIGGMLHSGILGLFLGAVILALGYRMFLAWLNQGALDAGETSMTADPAD